MRLNKFLNESINDKGIFKAVFMGGIPGSGKAQPLYSKIRVDDGWKTMGDINVGDFVYSPKNELIKVIETHPQGIMDIYRVHMFDGRHTDCTINHLWKIHCFNRKENGKSKRDWSVRGLNDLINALKKPNYKERMFLPLPKEINYNKKQLIINPYVFGVLLGDGCLKQRISFTSIDEELVDIVNENIDDYSIRTSNNIEYYICPNKLGMKSNYRKELEDLRIWGLYSYEKFIPEKYKYSNIEDRYNLIKGLMDTDGTVGKKGDVVFNTTSKKLADDFREVIWSLGGNTLINDKIPFYKNKDGEKIYCKKCYNITILHSNASNLFNLKRKKERCRNILTHKKRLFNKIKNIEYIGKHEAKCITVDSKDGLYLTDDYIVTHNSYTFSKIKSGQIEPRVVNTDKSFPLFKKYWNEDWGKIKVKVKTITKNQLALYINSLLPLAIDGTANETSVVLKRNGLLESFGYDTAMLFVNTSLETSIKRAGLRERQVDIDFIKSVYEQSEKAKNFYRGKFSTFIEIDNDEGELNEKAILHAFKFMNRFYNTKIINPVGVEYKRKMMENGWKYLSPNIYTVEEIQQVLGSWYKR